MANPVGYFREVSLELSRVTWPTRQKTINMTLLVIVVSILIAVILAGSDFVFQQVLSVILGN